MQNTKYVRESIGLRSNLSQICTPLLNVIENVQLGGRSIWWHQGVKSGTENRHFSMPFIIPAI